MAQETPRILRIKRKRDQDPLQALILENRNPKKLRRTSSGGNSTGPQGGIHPPNEVFFTLTRTDFLPDDNSCVLTESLDDGGSRKRKFLIPKVPDAEDLEILKELTSMLDTFLTVNGSEGGQRKRTRRRSSVVKQTEPRPVVEEPEYVYDVYHICLAEQPRTSANHPLLVIGYIRFFDDDENQLYALEDENDHGLQLSDDEDSNAEDFYQNDYPEDEDAGVYSETFELEDETEQQNYIMHEGDADNNEGGVEYDDDDEGYDDDDDEDVKIIIPDSSDVFVPSDQTYNDGLYDNNYELMGNGELDILAYLKDDEDYLPKDNEYLLKNDMLMEVERMKGEDARG